MSMCIVDVSVGHSGQAVSKRGQRTKERMREQQYTRTSPYVPCEVVCAHCGRADVVRPSHSSELVRRQFNSAAAPSLYDQVGVRAALGCDALTWTVSASPRHGDLRLPSLILAVPRHIIPHLHLLAL